MNGLLKEIVQRALPLLAASLMACGSMPALDLTRAVIVSNQPGMAATMLTEEVAKRSGAHWPITSRIPSNTPAVVLERKPRGGPAEGFSISIHGNRVMVSGNYAHGVLFGAGRFLRELRMKPGHVELPDGFALTTAPRYALRGHQLGYRNRSNSYDGWSVAMWEQYIRDLVVFGTNAIELIPPTGGEESASPHFPLPPKQMMVKMSRIAASYGMQVWLWYPTGRGDYSDPKLVSRSLKEWGETFRAIPKLDAVFVPGGDPGRTPPRVLFSFLQKQAANLRKYHPHAQIWVSPQSFNGDWTKEFFTLLKEQPSWLSGIVYGPEVRMSIQELRRKVPKRYPIRNYPDISHTTHAQFVQPDWDVAYALTYNREPIDPRPLEMRDIFLHDQPSSIGFVTYSEGCNDDVNKIIWSALGWDPNSDIKDILRQYARYFIGLRYEDSFSRGLLALERNWHGPLATNSGVYTTFEQFHSMEKQASAKDLLNWRFQMALCRAYYDAYQRRRLLHDTESEQEAMDVLRAAPRVGSLAAIKHAQRILQRSRGKIPAPEWRTRIFALAEALYQSVRLQSSVARYGAESRERGATLDNIDVPLNDGPWLKAQFASIRSLASESDRLKSIQKILNWANPGPGGFYDDLGDPANSPHLVRLVPYAQDPGHLRSPFTGFARRYWNLKKPWRISWLTDAESMFDAPVELRYTGLDRSASYRLRVIDGGEPGSVRTLQLTANGGYVIQPFTRIRNLIEPVEYPIPKTVTALGHLLLKWVRKPGLPGAGRGCQIAEVWLIRDAGHR